VPNLFISMDKLEQWSAEGKIALAGERMTILSDGRTYELVPAVRFIEELGETGDAQRLLGRVLPSAELIRLGGEHYMDSVVIGETAYRVGEVYIARSVENDAEDDFDASMFSAIPEGTAPAPTGPVMAAAGSTRPATALISDGPTGPDDNELLARLLLED